MEQARTQLKNLTPYERTCLIKEFLDEPFRSSLYCCAKCNQTGGEYDFRTVGDFWSCEVCDKILCSSCDSDLEVDGLCETCRGKVLCSSCDSDLEVDGLCETCRGKEEYEE